jgi:tRNA pseudouridine synthase 10
LEDLGMNNNTAGSKNIRALLSAIRNMSTDADSINGQEKNEDRLKGEGLLLGKRDYDILQIAIDALNQGYMCDRCLGRLFAKLLHGLSNEQRGKIVRDALALVIESGCEPDLYNGNFQSIIMESTSACTFCLDIFKELIPSLTLEAMAKSRSYEFTSFLVGTRLNSELFKKDIQLNQISPDYSESIKEEVNRTIGKRIELVYQKQVEHKEPDLFFLADLQKNIVSVESKNVYIYGGYKKLARGIPQTTWNCKVCNGRGCKKCKWTGRFYRTSVQHIIEKPILDQLSSAQSSFHGAGREDVDVRCLDYRQFIIEIFNPKKRTVDLERLYREINKSKSVQVSKLKLASKGDIASLKEERCDKTYHAVATFVKDVGESDLLKVFSLKGTLIRQKTPLRVVNRRADIVRERKIRDIEAKKLSARKVDLLIECEAGTYVKELISGDKGRTRPSISEVLDNDVKKIVLDVVKIGGGI